MGPHTHRSGDAHGMASQHKALPPQTAARLPKGWPGLVGENGTVERENSETAAVVLSFTFDGHALVWSTKAMQWGPGGLPPPPPL